MGCYELEQEEKAKKLGTDEAASKGINAYKSYVLATQMFEAAAVRGHLPSQEKMAWIHTRTGPSDPCIFTAGICFAQMALNSGSDWAKEFLNDNKCKQARSKICFYCYATAIGRETRFHSCGKCRIAHYCSKKCQKLHWHEYGHRDFCGKNIRLFKSDKTIEFISRLT